MKNTLMPAYKQTQRNADHRCDRKTNNILITFSGEGKTILNDGI